MTKRGFPALIVCAICGIAGVTVLATPRMAAGTAASGDMARVNALSSQTALELSAELARHRLTLVCPDAETHADLTYQRALMPDSFAAAAAEAVHAQKCRVRPANDRDFGQVMHN